MGLYYRQSDGTDICVSGGMSSSDAFKEIIAGSKSLQSSVNTTLTFTAGTGVTIAGDATTNTITISSTGSGSIATSDDTTYEALSE